MHLEDPEKEWWAETEMGLLWTYWFDGNVTASDGSVGTGRMSAVDGPLEMRERPRRKRGGGGQVGENGDGSLRSDPSTNSGPRVLSHDNRQ